MMRILYRCLLWLHPPFFRREFGGEMLWIFDEAATSEGLPALFGDAAISLARQWLLRSGSWKVAAAVAGGIAQVTVGGLAMLMFGHAQIASHLTAAQFTGTWRGAWHSADRSGPLEVVIGKKDGAWFGEIQMEGSPRVPAGDFAIEGNSVRFRAGHAVFRGKLLQDARVMRLAGTFAGTSAGTWEVSGPGAAFGPNPADRSGSGVALAMSSLIQLAICVVAGLLVMVIGLVFWVKGLFARRIHALSFSARPHRRSRGCATGNLAH